MRDIRIAAAQFEHRDGDKAYNLGRIRDLARIAAAGGAEIVCFHECSVTAYTFLQTLSRDELDALAEPVPDGPSVAALAGIANETRAVIMGGLIEREPDGRLFNSYVAVGPEGLLARFHKLHPFISPHLTPGRGYQVAEIRGVKVGFLICYDNNLPENVRATALLGAEVIVMPHVTGCTPSTMPGAARWTRRSGRIAIATRRGCGASSRVPRDGSGSCDGCRRGPGRTESSSSSPTTSAATATRSSRAWP